MRVILDTDLSMGDEGSEVDDGFALALALADPGLDVELVTTVAGNTDVDSATWLTLALLERLGRTDVPVVRGAAAPLTRPGELRRAPDAVRAEHGHRQPAPGRAALALVDAVTAAPGEVTVVAIGPLTNVALALALEPGFAAAAREVVVMGGVFLGHTGRAGVPGEFNLWSDPEAAAAVLASGAALRFVGLDVTRRVRLGRGDAARLEASPSAFGAFAGRCTRAWIDSLAGERRPGAAAVDSCAVHDPLAVAVLTRPELVTWARAHVDVVTGTGIARGVCVTDLLDGADAPAANCSIAVDVDAGAAAEHLVAAISAL